MKTGEGYRPISEPKGIPSDASSDYKMEAEEWGCDGHSHSYLTVAELKAYDWTQTTINTGLVDLGIRDSDPLGSSFVEMYKEGKTDEMPSMYYAGGTGVQISKEDAIKLLDAMNGEYTKVALIGAIENTDVTFVEEEFLSNGYSEVPKGQVVEWLAKGNMKGRINVRINWEISYKNAAGYFYDYMVEEMPAQFKGVADDEIRYVFFFDN